MTKITHTDAKQIITEAYRTKFGVLPSKPIRQLAQAIGWLETGYGQHWDERGRGRKNWGAIQAHEGWAGPTFEYVDTRPNDDGTSTPYAQKFRAYNTDLEGAADLCKVVYTGGRNPPLGHAERVNDAFGSRHRLVLDPAIKGDLREFSAGLYDTVYYQGFGRSRTERIMHHVLAVTNACAVAARETGESMPDGSEVPRPIKVLRRGATGDAVAIVQRIVGVPDDGAFGPKTESAVKVWQKAHSLKPDGVWGPVCYRVVTEEITGEELDALQGWA
jgi:hypothetical protein